MGFVQSGTKKKASGGVFKRGASKRLHQKAREPVNTRIGKTVVKAFRTPGNNRKYKLLMADSVNICDSKSKKCIKVKIDSVIDNPANRNFVKRNIITKGAIVDTKEGKVKITSRPGQDGTLNGIFI